MQNRERVSSAVRTLVSVFVGLICFWFPSATSAERASMIHASRNIICSDDRLIVKPIQAMQSESPVTLPAFWGEELLQKLLADDGGIYTEPVSSDFMGLKRAYRLVTAGHYEEAIKEYEACPKCLDLPSPFYSSELRGCGFAYERLGRTADALRVYERTNQSELRAELLVRLGRFSEAKEIASQKLSPPDPYDMFHRPDHVWYRIRAAAEAGLGDDEAAVKDLIQAATTQPPPDFATCMKDANVLIARSKLGKPWSIPGMELPKQGKLHFAAPQNKRDGEATKKETRDRLESTVRNCSKKIARYHEFPDAYRDRARALAKLGRYSEALLDANRSIKFGGRSYIRERGAIEQEMGQYEAAVKDFTDCLSNHTPGPETKELWLSLAAVYLKDKQYHEAVSAADKAMMIGPEKARAYFLKARAEAALGLMTQAREDGKTAAAECFDHARIVLRDEVEDWLKTLSDGHS